MYGSIKGINAGNIYKMPEVDSFNRTVYGPYFHAGEKRRFVLLYWDGGQKTTSFARWKMEVHLGRHLEPHEHVDHIDNNRLNDDISNLQILTQAENNAKSARKPEMMRLNCKRCKIEIVKLASNIRGNQGRRGCDGPFCGKRCASLWQFEHGKLPIRSGGVWHHGTENCYGYRKCRCSECRAAHVAHVREYRERKRSLKISKTEA